MQKVCEYCGDKFITTWSFQIYCSKRCKEMGPTSKARYGGLHYYVLKRDGFKCVDCGETEKLHVHHIDEVVSHNEMSNLVTLCQSCHKHLHHSGERNNHYKHITKEQVERAIEASGNLEDAAKLLGITRSALRNKRKLYGMGHISTGRQGEQSKQYIHLSLQEVEMAYELEGTWLKASQRLGVSEGFLRRRYKELKGSGSGDPRHKHLTKEQIVQAYEECGSWKGVMEKIGISKSSLTYNRKKYGLM